MMPSSPLFEMDDDDDDDDDDGARGVHLSPQSPSSRVSRKEVRGASKSTMMRREGPPEMMMIRTQTASIGCC
jgi:hypothetical protein